jgi:glyoxylase-like metal-dependent hydrolase (beta-lactamase superfamily II)
MIVTRRRLLESVLAAAPLILPQRRNVKSSHEAQTNGSVSYNNRRSAVPVITIGNVALHRVEAVRIPNKIAYFTQDQELLAAHRHWLAPHFLDEQDRFDLVFHSWIFEVDGRVVVLDPCAANGVPNSVPFFNNLDVPFIERMETTGFRPHDIDLVVCTHLHHDHCGWNTQLREGKWVPTFPKARYVMNQTDIDRMGKNREYYRTARNYEGSFEHSVLPVMEAGLAELVSGTHRLTPGMVVEPAPGHTLGHQLLHLVSAGKHALFTGDCFHHPIQLVEPSIAFGDSDDMEQVIATRRKLVERAANLDALLIAAHVQAPYAVRVWREGQTTHFGAAFSGSAQK